MCISDSSNIFHIKIINKFQHEIAENSILISNANYRSSK